MFFGCFVSYFYYGVRIVFDSLFPMKKHILFILDYYTPHKGWAETVFEHITHKLLARGYTITVITSRFLPHLPIYESLDGISVYRTGSGRLSFLFFAVWLWLKLCRKFSIDFVHTSTYGWAIPAWIIALLTGKKVILTVHEVFGDLWSVYKKWPKSLLYKWFEWFIFFFHYTAYHVVSTYTLNSIRCLYHVPDKLIRLVYNGVDSDFWNPKKISKNVIKDWRKKYGRWDRFVFLYYGHSGKSKGLDYLIDALPAIFAHYPDILFVCNLIHAKRDGETKQKIRTLWYNKNIQLFSGFSLENLRTLVAASDCVIAPSLSEWFGSVHAEVSAIGKPLITSYVASIPEVVHGKVVFTEPQSSQAIVDAVVKVRNDQFTSIDTKLFPREKTIDGIEQLYKDFIW